MSDSRLASLLHTAANNDAVRSGLLQNPRSAFAKAGIELPAGVEVTTSVSGAWGIQIAVGPAGGLALSEEFLDGTSGGAGCAQP